MTTTSGSLWRLALFTIAMIAAFALVLTMIQRPVAGATETHDALFTDANGLRIGDDVRVYGVQVGKVEGIRLDGTLARVRLTVKTDTPLYDNTRLAIRYQNLTGQRYVDIQHDPAPGARIRPGALVPADHTVPSFDITALFNGLEPVLRTLSPDALNRFTTSMLAVLEGEGKGIGPALASIGELSAYVGDRQRVLTTLVRNLSEIADRIGGRSPQLVNFLGKVSDVFESLQKNLEGLIDFALTAPPVLYPADRLLATIGLTVGENPDVNEIVRRYIPDPKAIADLLAGLPALLEGLDAAIPSPIPGSTRVCAKGDAEVPAPLRVLVDGRRVSVCKR
ncbi:MlaD family protein [Nocardia sp. NPDC004068]|uniref:MlaD family protein n=1 Tax=Nocardia sp. NPDC004068 TaxID=3364303 RepID=UPI0036A7C82F